mgnify:CR=1 FL=1
MKGRIFGVMAAGALGLTSVAGAAGLELTDISPPGAGNVGSEARLYAGPQGSLFSDPAATDGDAESISAADLQTIVDTISPVVGQVYVFAVDNSVGESSMIILSGGSIGATILTAGSGDGVYQTGGVNIQGTTTGGVPDGGWSSTGTLNTSGHAGLESWAAFVYDDMDMFTTGGVTLFGGSGTIGNSATVNFLAWNAVTSSYDVATSSNMDGSISFNFQVVPVPAPALLAGVGLLGAGIVRRRMAKN